jgi:hypothetical protein
MLDSKAKVVAGMVLECRSKLLRDLACADRDAALELGKESRPDWSFCGVVELTASSRTVGDSDTQLQEKATIAV